MSESSGVRIIEQSSVAPQWLKSSKVTGLDQLGIQVISIALYSDLLPGITNVTDRIRYYSFYPWLLHRYASDIKKLDLTTWQDHLRRAEFLLALIGRDHHKDNQEGGEAIVGADRANKALAEIEAKPNKTWKLSKWAAVANAGQPGSYFKNKNGGFGQYYRGQLASLGLINLDDESLGVKLAKGIGVEIAEICDSQTGRKEFWKAVKSDKVTLKILNELGDSMCPCAVCEQEAEKNFLTNLMFGPDERSAPDSYSRASSLRLLLSVLDQSKELKSPVDHFRQLAYYEHDEDGNPFQPSSNQSDVFAKWTIYEAGEFVNYALEIAFDAVLQHLKQFDIVETEAARFVSSTVDAALKSSSSNLNLGSHKTFWRNRTLGELIEEANNNQKSLAQWSSDPWSEYNLLFDDPNEHGPLVRLARAFACLISVYARNRIPARPFDAFAGVSPDWLARYRVTLSTVHEFLKNRRDQNAASVLGELLKQYVVGQHLRVAMRKLRQNSQSTFKLAIESGHFIWLNDFEPTLTNPRLRQAFRFLRDLELCKGASENWKLTSAGKLRMRQSNGD